MANVIKGLTVEIGGDTTKLGKALEDVNKKSRDLSGELGQINKLLKLDPSNTALLAQKQKVLAEAISNTEAKLDTLREAEKQVQAQFERGEVSEEQYRALQREIIATEKKLEGYKKAAQETADAAKKMTDGAKSTADALDDEADKAEEAKKVNEDLGDGLAAVAMNGFTALAAAAAATVAAIASLAEETREYRTALGKLGTAFIEANFSAETAYETYSGLQGVLGETDQAVEASNHLAELCDTEEELANWTDILTGVHAKFGDSLAVEGLAEAANETAKTGQVTGTLADALNWAAEEGETFGVTLKENIDFTELSAKELEALTDAQREEYEARKEQYDAIEDYNKRVGEAVSAEDKFNIALENCTDEQERQKLITTTLTKKYKSAATQYKKTNAEIIRANEATEKWNAVMAKNGGYMEPVMTDVKELGITLLEYAQLPLKNAAKFARNEFLPAVSSIGSWVRQNVPMITSTVAGLTAVMVAHKAAVFASELATKGLTVATLGQQAAQKALNVVMAGGPWGIVLTAVAGVAAALTVLALTTDEAKAKVDVLTAEEKLLAAVADETAESFRKQQTATKESLVGISSQMRHVNSLATELHGLADASGRVKEKDQERAQFILNEINKALGTEYTMVDGVIQRYDALKTSINDVIQAKLANSLVEAANADYVAAIQAEGDALHNLSLKEQEYQAQLAYTQAKEQEYAELQAQIVEARNNLKTGQDARALQSLAVELNALQTELAAEQGALAEKKAAYDQAAIDYGNYANTIANYEEAQAAVLNENYDLAVDLLTEKGHAFGEYSDKVDDETAAVIDSLYKEAIDAGIEALRTKKNFEKGIDGYTEEMVKEAEKSYEDALDAYANAYADAEGVGSDLSAGLENGMESGRNGLLGKARSLVAGIISAMRDEADSHSPARKLIDFGEDVGEGAEIGIDNKTSDVKKAATNQAAAILDAYNSQEVAGQKALRNVAERQASQRMTSQLIAAATNAPLLENILAAIERGQIITIDGSQLVGATAGRMDTTLGQRRVLAARGAL